METAIFPFTDSRQVSWKLWLRCQSLIGVIQLLYLQVVSDSYRGFLEWYQSSSTEEPFIPVIINVINCHYWPWCYDNHSRIQIFCTRASFDHRPLRWRIKLHHYSVMSGRTEMGIFSYLPEAVTAQPMKRVTKRVKNTETEIWNALRFIF